MHEGLWIIPVVVSSSSCHYATELVNILQKYIKSKYTWQTALKQPKPTIISSECVSTSFCM